jgi:hypothetical protein
MSDKNLYDDARIAEETRLARRTRTIIYSLIAIVLIVSFVIGSAVIVPIVVNKKRSNDKKAKIAQAEYNVASVPISNEEEERQNKNLNSLDEASNDYYDEIYGSYASKTTLNSPYTGLAHVFDQLSDNYVYLFDPTTEGITNNFLGLGVGAEQLDYSNMRLLAESNNPNMPTVPFSSGGSGLQLTPIQIQAERIAQELCPQGPNSPLERKSKFLGGIPVDMCLQKCPINFETVFFVETSPTNEIRGKPIPFCRAICPFHIHALSGRILSTTPSGKPARSDSFEGNAAYCQVNVVQRSLQRGERMIKCPWIIAKTWTAEPNAGASGTNRHNCDSNGTHWNWDPSDYCQRRRTIPRWDNKFKNETPVCGGYFVRQGSTVDMNVKSAPVACTDGDLLPMTPMAWFDNRPGKRDNDVDSARFGGSVDNIDDQNVMKFNAWMCFSHCPYDTVPIKKLEEHYCAESCPANTFRDPITWNEPEKSCRKVAYQQSIIIANMAETIADILKDVA